jgi:hypothetical protein
MKTFVLKAIRFIIKRPLVEKLFKAQAEGKEPNSFWVKLLPPHLSYPKGSLRKHKTPGGTLFLLDISDLVDWYLYFGIKEEAHEKLYKLCQESEVIFDIGTNIGAVLLQMAEMNPRAVLHGFEPDTHNYAKAKRNLGLNNIKNVFLHNLALGEAISKAYLRGGDVRKHWMIFV